ncbi:hypothetical protein BH11GEM1_BH11GEM1_24370 [soil metagenome]
MRRSVTSRLLLPCLAFVVALSAPATAVAHGLAHDNESAIHQWSVHPRAADAARAHGPTMPTVDAADADDGHPAMHATCAAQKPGHSPAALPADRWPDLSREQWESRERVPAFAILVHASPHDDLAAQPRAPPLG